MFLAPLLLSAQAYAFNGWAGYGWPASRWAGATFKVPALRAPDGAEAFWAGLGKGDPGIQQVGISCGYSHGSTSCNAWYEMWPAPAHGFGYRVLPGNTMRFSVIRSGTSYTLTVRNLSRGWTSRVVRSYPYHEGEGEAVVEAFGPSPSGFRPAYFSQTSGPTDFLYSWPFGGEYAVRDSTYSFTIHRT